MRNLLTCLVSILSLSAFSQKYADKGLVTIDTHNDVLSTAILKGLHIEDDLSGKTYSDLARFRKGGVNIQVFSIFCDERYGKGTAFNYALREMDSLDAIAARNPSKMMLVNTMADLRKAVRTHKLGAMKGVEGGHMIEDDLNLLDSLYKRGARYMTLTWNNSTSWASSAWDETNMDAGKPVTITQKGLNDFGRQVVKRMNELGMLVDLSHVGRQTFFDALSVTTKPVIVSHSCAYAICPVPRNLTDEQILAIGKNGGVIHINFYSAFLDSNYSKHYAAFVTRHQPEVDSLKNLKAPEYEIGEFLAKKYPEEADALRPSMNLLIDHIDHIVKLIGVDHVGLGSDFDGIDSAPQDLDGVEDMPLIASALMVRGYTKADIRKIMGGNFIRLFKSTGN